MGCSDRIEILIHPQYRLPKRHHPFSRFVSKKSRERDRLHLGMYLDWWTQWIQSAPVPIRYEECADLLFSHPLAFCKIIIGTEEYLVGFDFWDKYPVYAHHPKAEPDIRARWDLCKIHFKTNYFDAEAPFRFRGPLGFVPKEDDAGREAAEEAYHAEDIFPCGMPTFQGLPFKRHRYRRLRQARRTIDVNASGKKLGYDNLIRDAMVDKLHDKFPISFSGTYEQYLRRLGRTKICVDFPSNSRVTFRSSEAIALGTLLIGPPVCNVYPPGFRLEELMCACETDLSDLDERIEYHLRHGAERRALAEKAAAAWDRIMAPESLSAYWIKTCVEFLRG